MPVRRRITPPVLDVDLERSWLDHLVEHINTERLAIDEPGKLFAVKGRDRWIEPRLMRFSPTERSLRVPFDDVTMRVICYVKVESKGARQLVLSEVIDEVRRVLDPRRSTKNLVSGVLRVKNCDGEEVGILQCSPPSESRAYNQTASIRGDQLVGLDLAILTVPCKLTSNVCG